MIQLQKDAVKAAEISMATAIVSVEALLSLGVIWWVLG